MTLTPTRAYRRIAIGFAVLAVLSGITGMGVQGRGLLTKPESRPERPLARGEERDNARGSMRPRPAQLVAAT